MLMLFSLTLFISDVSLSMISDMGIGLGLTFWFYLSYRCFLLGYAAEFKPCGYLFPLVLGFAEKSAMIFHYFLNASALATVKHITLTKDVPG